MTLVYTACAGTAVDGDYPGSGWLYPDSGIYLTDQLGHKYDLMENKAEFSTRLAEDNKTLEYQPRWVARGEFYRFALVFPSIPQVSTVKTLTLHHPQFADLAMQINIPPVELQHSQLPAEYTPSNWLRFTSNPVSVVSNSAVGGAAGQGIRMWVEQVGIGHKGTLLTVACQYFGGSRKSLYSAKAGDSQTYLLDDKGHKYRLLADVGEYQNRTGEPPVHELYGAYRFQLIFRPLASKTDRFTFNHWQFPPLVISLDEEGTAESTQNLASK